MRCVWHPVGPPIEHAFAVVALQIVTLLSSGELDRVRSCGDPRCGWVFLDRSRNRSCRWCHDGLRQPGESAFAVCAALMNG